MRTDAQKEAQRRYAKSEKGREARRRANARYALSKKGQAAKAKADSEYKAKLRGSAVIDKKSAPEGFRYRVEREKSRMAAVLGLRPAADFYGQPVFMDTWTKLDRAGRAKQLAEWKRVNEAAYVAAIELLTKEL